MTDLTCEYAETSTPVPCVLAAELSTIRAENERMREALTTIADGLVGPSKEGHYLAHREAVRLARNILNPVPVLKNKDEKLQHEPENRQ
jgi:hypothetical protein